MFDLTHQLLICMWFICVHVCGCIQIHGLLYPHSVQRTFQYRFFCTQIRIKNGNMALLICAVFYWLYLVLYSRQHASTLHALLLCACLHFKSLKVKLICSIITHLGKLLSRCQHNLLPSALMAAQLWMVDGYLIEETTSHWAWEEDSWEKEQRVTSPVCFVPIHSLIRDSVEKWFHLAKS